MPLGLTELDIENLGRLISHAGSDQHGHAVPWANDYAESRGIPMTQVTATFINGMLKPDLPLPLTDQSRVRLTIEPIADWSPEEAQAAWQSILARSQQHPIHGGGVRYTRDELHERR
jgi:hypothetical protein